MKKGVAVAVLLVLLSMTGALAWTVFCGTLSDVTGSVTKASASVTTIPIDIGTVKSGYDFSATVSNADAITVSNAKELNIEISVTNTTEEIDAGAFQNCYVDVAIYDDSQEYVRGTIDVLNPTPITGTLPEGVYDVDVTVYGTAGYPQEDVPIDFDVIITVNTPT